MLARPISPALPPPGKLGGQDSFESIESYDSCDRLTQSWSSQSSFQSLQRVPSYDSFDSEDYPATLPSHKPKGTFKDYVRDRADMNKDKPVIPAAALAGYTGREPTILGNPSVPPSTSGSTSPSPGAEPQGALSCPSSVWLLQGGFGVSLGSAQGCISFERGHPTHATPHGA